MPRTARTIRAGICYHVINRGNARATVFHDAEDFAVFLALARESARRSATDMLAFCLMPNHFHFVLRPSVDDGLSRWAHWLLTCHVRRYLRRYSYVGRVWQGRFKAFPVQTDAHLFAVMRYVESNALRAGLVPRAELWPWGSLRWRGSAADDLMPGILPMPLTGWIAQVNAVQPRSEIEAIGKAMLRGAPYGDAAWSRDCVETLGLQATLRRRGRPRAPRPSVDPSAVAP